MKLTKLACIALTAGLIGTGAQATIFDFAYTSMGGDVLSGQLDGTLQADANTVLVDAVLNAFFNGSDGPALPVVDAFSNRVGGSGLPATVTVDGSFMDFIACTSGACVDGFGFDSDISFYSAGPAFGPAGEDYDSAAWSLSPVVAIPLPASLLLLLGALGGLGAVRLRAV